MKSGRYGHQMKDARTGEIIWSSPKGALDVGRGGCDDIDPTHKGSESWSSMGMLISSDGSLITDKYSIPANFFAWWDGDLGREVQDGVNISKCIRIHIAVQNIFTADKCHSNNAAKSNPTLTADILVGLAAEEGKFNYRTGRCTNNDEELVLVLINLNPPNLNRYLTY